jgi:hypothetical protein
MPWWVVGLILIVLAVVAAKIGGLDRPTGGRDGKN